MRNAPEAHHPSAGGEEVLYVVGRLAGVANLQRHSHHAFSSAAVGWSGEGGNRRRDGTVELGVGAHDHAGGERRGV